MFRVCHHSVAVTVSVTSSPHPPISLMVSLGSANGSIIDLIGRNVTRRMAKARERERDSPYGTGTGPGKWVRFGKNRYVGGWRLRIAFTSPFFLGMAR